MAGLETMKWLEPDSDLVSAADFDDIGGPGARCGG